MEYTIIIVVLVIMGLAIAFAIGANDESMATTVGAGTLSIKQAVAIGGTVAFIGVVFLSGGVGKTIGVGLLSADARVYYTEYTMLAILISTTAWLIVGSVTGAPLSTTHSVVGSIFGVALVISISTGMAFVSVLNASKMTSVVMAWFLSPALGYVAAYLVERLMQKTVMVKIQGLDDVEKSERYFGYALLGCVLVTQVSRGGNDAANAIGVFYALQTTDPSFPVTLFVVLAAVCLALGLVVIGRIVIKNLGDNLVEMRPSSAFSIQLTVSVLVLACTLLGLPISGTHILVFAMLGNARARGEQMDKKNLKKMIATWVLTFPVAMVLAMAIFWAFIGGGLVAIP
ncbi:MAG: inorganic phosphate transporter [Promethearchaeota archaeon]